MTNIEYYPPELYRFMLNVAFKYKLAIKEVVRIFLSDKARELGFECFHEKIGYSKSDSKPYCKGCWTRLEELRQPIWRLDAKDRRKKQLVQAGLYRPLDTFLDIEEKEKAKQEQQQAPPPPPPPSSDGA